MNLAKLTNCPKCRANWIESEIPEEIREHYSPPYFFTRLIGIYDPDKDRTVKFICPDCKTEFESWT